MAVIIHNMKLSEFKRGAKIYYPNKYKRLYKNQKLIAMYNPLTKKIVLAKNKRR